MYILLGTLLVIHNMPHVPHTCALRPSAWIFVELSLLPGAQVPWAQCSLSWPLSSDDLMVPAFTYDSRCHHCEPRTPQVHSQTGAPVARGSQSGSEVK